MEDKVENYDTSLKDEQDDDCCPICLGECTGQEQEMVVGKCKHPCCLRCLKRVFAQRHYHNYNANNMNRQSDNSYPDISMDAVLNLPTKGRCPVCRSMLDVFELKYHRHQDSSSSSEEYVYPKQSNELSIDLTGKVFVRNRRREGDWSIHFPAASSLSSSSGSSPKNDGSRSENMDMDSDDQTPPPYLSLENIPKESVVFDDGTSAAGRKIPFRHYRYHIDSRTFHGTIVWEDGERTEGQESQGEVCSTMLLQGSNRWDFLISFSSGCRYVSHGVIIKYKEENTTDSTATKSATTKISNNTINNEQSESSVMHIMQFGTGHDDDNDGEINDGDNRHGMHSFSSRRGQLSSSFYHLLGVDTTATNSTSIPSYNPESLWGNVFCQVLTVGMASYHFLCDGTERAYISYEHERTSVWPHLDNGRPIPSRIFFTETQYDDEQKCFRGKIDWEGTHQTTWNGSRYWRYCIYFAKDFSCIIGGTVLATQNDSDAGEESEMSRFGSDLVYLNCGLLEEMRENDGSGGGMMSMMMTTGGSTTASGLTDRLRSIRQQMEEHSSAPESIDRLQALFVLAQSREISYPTVRY